MEELANKDTYKSYLFFWSGQVVSLLGSMVVYFVIAYWIAATYKDPILLAIASFLFIAVMTVCMPIAGVIADKFNRKITILVVDSLQAVSTFVLIILFQIGVANIFVVFIFISIRSGFQAVHVPTVNTIIPSMVPKDKLTRINGINSLFTGVVQLLAPLIGALLFMFLSMYLILWVDIITFFIAVVPLLLVSIPTVHKTDSDKQESKKPSFLEEFKLGLKTLKLVPGLIIMVVLSMILNFLVKPIDALFPLFIIDTHGGNALYLAIAEMLFTGGMIAGAIFTSVKKEWKNQIQTVFISIILACFGYATMALAPRGWLLVLGIGGFVMGFNLPIINSLYITYMQKTVPTDKIGRVTSIDHTLSSAISPFGSLLSGPLALILGIPMLFFYSSLIGIIFTLAFWSFTGIRKVNLDDEIELNKINQQITNEAS